MPPGTRYSRPARAGYGHRGPHVPSPPALRGAPGHELGPEGAPREEHRLVQSENLADRSQVLEAEVVGRPVEVADLVGASPADEIGGDDVVFAGQLADHPVPAQRGIGAVGAVVDQHHRGPARLAGLDEASAEPARPYEPGVEGRRHRRRTVAARTTPAARGRADGQMRATTHVKSEAPWPSGPQVAANKSGRQGRAALRSQRTRAEDRGERPSGRSEQERETGASA